MDFLTEHSDKIHDAQIDFFGTVLATASSDKLVKIFNLSEGNPPSFQTNLEGHKGPVWKVRWAHPKFGKVLASCGYARQLLIWSEGEDGKWSPILDDRSFAAPVIDVDFIPPEFGLGFGAVSSDGMLFFYYFDNKNQKWNKHTSLVHNFTANSISFAPYCCQKTLRFSTGGGDNLVKFWSLDTSSIKTKAKSVPLSISISLLTQAEKTQNGGLFKEEEIGGQSDLHSNWVQSVAWAPSLFGGSETVASVSSDGSVFFWTTGENGKWNVFCSVELEGELQSASWSPIGDRLAVSNAEGKVWLLKRGPGNGWDVSEEVETEI